MINQITGLFNKTDELEQYLDNFKRVQNRASKKNSCLSFFKNFSNLEVVLPKKILIAKFQAKKNSRIFFQSLLEFSLVTSETVEFYFSINDIAISSEQKTLNSGSNQLVIMRNYEPLEDGELSIYLTIKPKKQKQVYLSMISLFVWGDLEERDSTSYLATQTADKIALSMIDNNSLYYKFTDKQKTAVSFLDFSYFAPAISHSVVYDEVIEKLLLFRVDTRGNLFLSDGFNGNEFFITGEVKKVSACSNNNGNVLVVVIKNNGCRYFEIDKNKNISIFKEINCGFVNPTDAEVFFNEYNGKFCVVLSDKNGSNYYVEQINETAFLVDNISANYCIDIKII